MGIVDVLAAQGLEQALMCWRIRVTPAYCGVPVVMQWPFLVREPVDVPTGATHRQVVDVLVSCRRKFRQFKLCRTCRRARPPIHGRSHRSC